MYKRSFMLGLAMLLAASGCTHSDAMRRGKNVSTLPSRPFESGHAPVNGISMYYEVHGRRDGIPLVLLHGGGSTIEVTFSRVLPIFASHCRVIAVEEQGHGRTTDRDAPVTFESSADDVAALLRHLKIEKADIFGFSNGASVALQVAIRHPHLVRKLIFASSITKRDGARPQFWEFMKEADFSNMPQPLKDAFLRVNPDMQKLKTMHDKDAARMRNFKDVPDELVRSVQAPTLIVLGDQDIVKPEHAVELTRLIPSARLLILPGGHGDYLGEAVMTQAETRAPELTAQLIEEFLDPQGGQNSMEAKHDVRHISVSINRPPNEVYDFASNPENLPKWATGLGGSIKKVNGEWVADSPMGKIRIRMAEKNAFGVLDHDVIVKSGKTVYNPMRVVPHGEGSEVTFTLFRQPGVSDEKFSEDAKWVKKDMNILKDLLEKKR